MAPIPLLLRGASPGRAVHPPSGRRRHRRLPGLAGGGRRGDPGALPAVPAARRPRLRIRASWFASKETHERWLSRDLPAADGSSWRCRRSWRPAGDRRPSHPFRPASSRRACRTASWWPRRAGPPSSSLAVSRDLRPAHRRRPGLPLAGVRSDQPARIGRDPTGDDSWGPEHSVFDIALAPGLGAAEQRRIAGAGAGPDARLPGPRPDGHIPLRQPAGFEAIGRRAAVPGDASSARIWTPWTLPPRRIASVLGALPGARDVRVDNPRLAPRW